MKELRKRTIDLLGDWRGYPLAVVLVALATWLKYLAQPNVIPGDVTLLYFLAIVPSAIFFGLGPSILACILSITIYDFLFVPPIYSPIIFHIQHAPTAAIFLAVAIVVSYLSSDLHRKNQIAAKEISARRQTEVELTNYKDHLEDLVEQRTHGLEKANLSLKDEITQRKKVEKALEESQERFNLAQKAAGAGAWEWDLRTSKNHWSEEIWELYGLEPHSCEPSYDAWAKTIHPDDRPIAEKAVQEAIKTGTKLTTEWRVISRPENERWLMAVGQPVLDEHDEASRYIGIVIDITDRKKLDQLKDDFIGMVSHEIKTPLTVMIGALNIVEIEGVSPEQREELIKSAKISAEELAAMVDNLLELSRHQANRLSLQTNLTQIEPVTQAVVERFRKRSVVHQFVIDIPDDLPPVMIDTIRIERVLSNLVENAIKYSPNGGKVRIFGHLSGDQFIIGVSDQGIGISPEDQTRLFEQFQRLHIQDKYSIAGVGLGLRVCRILVETHGGHMWVESELGKGSTFFFSLPAANK